MIFECDRKFLWNLSTFCNNTKTDKGEPMAKPSKARFSTEQINAKVLKTLVNFINNLICYKSVYFSTNIIFKYILQTDH